MRGHVFRIAVMVLTVAAFGYMMVTGGSPTETTVAQAALVIPILVVVLLAVGYPAWQRWQETRAVKEVRRNQQRRAS